MKSLFKPITINKLEVPNRIAMAPMTRMMSPDGIPGENVKAVSYTHLRAHET